MPDGQPVANWTDLIQQGPEPDLRIGRPEREAAREALEEHLAVERLDSVEYEQRWAACQVARTQAELLHAFVDLPAPHPELPGVPRTPPGPETDDDIPSIAVPVCITLLLGLPVATVLGFVYGAWWGLAVPVAISVAMLYAEHLLTQSRQAHANVGPDIASSRSQSPSPQRRDGVAIQ
jgi:Domain of unknown function (DUF1707)